jgi:hypothetical protein
VNLEPKRVAAKHEAHRRACATCSVTHLAFALRCARKMVRGLREAMTEDERYAVADHVVTEPQEVREPMEAARRGATERRTDHRRARGADSEE